MFSCYNKQRERDKIGWTETRANLGVFTISYFTLFGLSLEIQVNAHNILLLIYALQKGTIKVMFAQTLNLYY